MDVTEIHAHDDVALNRYDPAARSGPIHLINVCLNQNRGPSERAVQRRPQGRAAGCQRARHADRHAQDRWLRQRRAGQPWTLVAISGAAASPGAGVYTTPGWAALLFLGGARLGCWLDVGDASRTHGSAAPGQRSVHAWLRDAFNAAKMGRLYAEFRAVCDQLKPRAWMQDRQGAPATRAPCSDRTNASPGRIGGFQTARG